MLVNVLFAITLVICSDLTLHRLRTVWLIVNIAYLPVMLWMRGKKHQQRVLIMEHVVKSAFTVVGMHALFFFSLITFLGIDLPLKLYVVYYGLMAAGVPLWWIVSRRIIKTLRRRGYNYLRVAIVGTGPTAMRLYDELQSDAGFGYKVLGFFSDEVHPSFNGKLLGNIDDLSHLAGPYQIDQIFYTLSGSTKEDALTSVVKICDDNVIQFYYVPQISRRVSRSFQLNSVGRVPMLSLTRNPLNSLVNRTLKRTFDLAFSSVVLLFSPLVFVPVAIAIKCSSPGPVFFRQERTGYKGHTFKCWKFRTMRVNDNADSQQATSDDPRTTRVGHFLRRTSIDELPQFINVWLGDMSVVGPRPHMLKHTEDYTKVIDKYMVRHAVLPGITGWAQVHGYRGVTDELWKMEKRVEYDVWYVENWNFLLDLKIIVRTVMNWISGEENAY